MVVSESESIGYGNIIATNGNGNIKPESSSSPQQEQQLQLEEEEDQSISKDGSFSSLQKQNSILSLTLDEIQCKSGRSFGSMNMDEFLANIWSVEENDEVPNSQLNNQDDEPPLDKTNTDADAAAAAAQQPAGAGALSRQGSFSIPIPLCKKTVDEVWFEIHKDQPPPLQEASSHFPCLGPQRQQTLGEMTLEDFLVKAGVVQNRASQNRGRVAQTPIHGNNMANNNDACLDTRFGMGHHVMGSGYTNPQHGTARCSGGSNNGFGTYPMFGQSSNILVGGAQVVSNSTCNDAIEKCHSLTESGGLKNKKRIVDGPPEVVVERRQRRMIKNRESAARSRARKQAYTVELEVELNQLREENAKLKQMVAETEQNRKQEVLRRKQTTMSTKAQKLADKLKTIRRAVSSAW